MAKPFACDVCPLKYRNLKDLLCHRKLSHLTAPNYKCRDCGRGFVLKKELTAHCKMTHGLPTFSCDICSKECYSITSLRYHEKTHSRPFQCKICPKAFFRKVQYSRHMAKKHENIKTDIELPKSISTRSKFMVNTLHLVEDSMDHTGTLDSIYSDDNDMNNNQSESLPSRNENIEYSTFRSDSVIADGSNSSDQTFQPLSSNHSTFLPTEELCGTNINALGTNLINDADKLKANHQSFQSSPSNRSTSNIQLSGTNLIEPIAPRVSCKVEKSCSIVMDGYKKATHPMFQPSPNNHTPNNNTPATQRTDTQVRQTTTTDPINDDDDFDMSYPTSPNYMPSPEYIPIGLFGFKNISSKDIDSTHSDYSVDMEHDNGTSVNGNNEQSDGTSVDGNNEQNDGTSVDGDNEQNDVTSVDGNNKQNDGTSVDSNNEQNDGTSVDSNNEQNDGTSVDGDNEQNDVISVDGDNEQNDSISADGNNEQNDGTSVDGNNEQNDGISVDGNNEKNDGTSVDGNNEQNDGTSVDGNNEQNDGTSVDGEVPKEMSDLKAYQKICKKFSRNGEITYTCKVCHDIFVDLLTFAVHETMCSETSDIVQVISSDSECSSVIEQGSASEIEVWVSSDRKQINRSRKPESCSPISCNSEKSFPASCRKKEVFSKTKVVGTVFKRKQTDTARNSDSIFPSNYKKESIDEIVEALSTKRTNLSSNLRFPSSNKKGLDEIGLPLNGFKQVDLSTISENSSASNDEKQHSSEADVRTVAKRKKANAPSNTEQEGSFLSYEGIKRHGLFETKVEISSNRKQIDIPNHQTQQHERLDSETSDDFKPNKNYRDQTFDQEKESSDQEEIEEDIHKIISSEIFQCIHCAMKFYLRVDHHRHELNHELAATMPTGVTYICIVCGCSFDMTDELIDHVACHEVHSY